jgi:hypothetical protein
MEFKEKINVSVVEQLSMPLEMAVGREVGAVMLELAKKNGVRMFMGAKIERV